ncbi:unnamed protein product, partial [Adineta ricciae]
MILALLVVYVPDGKTQAATKTSTSTLSSMRTTTSSTSPFRITRARSTSPLSSLSSNPSTSATATTASLSSISSSAATTIARPLPLVSVNGTVSGVYNTTIGGNSTASTSGYGMGQYPATEKPSYACDTER